jgi:hypothetical protein
MGAYTAAEQDHAGRRRGDPNPKLQQLSADPLVSLLPAGPAPPGPSFLRSQAGGILATDSFTVETVLLKTLSSCSSSNSRRDGCTVRRSARTPVERRDVLGGSDPRVSVGGVIRIV